MTCESTESLLSHQLVAEYGSPVFASLERVASVGTLRVEEMDISHTFMLTIFVHVIG